MVGKGSVVPIALWFLLQSFAISSVSSRQQAEGGVDVGPSDSSMLETVGGATDFVSPDPISLDDNQKPLICPRTPLFPGISSIQVLECDVEYPEPDICGLRILKGIRVRLQPGQTLAVEYRNLNSAAAQLSRLVLSPERISFELLGITPEAMSTASQAPAPMLFLASGLCPDLVALSTCLEATYRGAPLYRACPGCLGLNVVSEVQGLQEGYGWFGEAAGAGDTSFFRSQLLEGTASMLYFLASMSSYPVKLSYGRAARVLYVPGTRVARVPSGLVNETFEGVEQGEGGEARKTTGSGDGSDGNGTGSLPAPATSPPAPDGTGSVSTAAGDAASRKGPAAAIRNPDGAYGPPPTPTPKMNGPGAAAGRRPSAGNGAGTSCRTSQLWRGRLLLVAAQCLGAVLLAALCGLGADVPVLGGQAGRLPW